MTEGRFCVLDIETRLGCDAVLRVPRDRRPTIERVALQEVFAAAVLTFKQAEDGMPSGFELECHELDDGDEAGLLIRLAGRVDAEHRAASTLVTYNGVHDLSVLRRRAGRHWLFDRFEVPEWRDGSDRHLDLMRVNRYGGDRAPSLVDACAGFGFDAWPPSPLLRTHGAPSGGDKCSLDVVATTLLLFHELSFRERSPLPLMRGWVAMAAALTPMLGERPFLAPILRHPAVKEASALLAKRDLSL